MKVPSALKLEISNFSLHPLGFDGDRSGLGYAFWLGGSLVEIGIIFSAIVCFPFFMVRSQVLLNAVFGREEGGVLFGRVFFNIQYTQLYCFNILMGCWVKKHSLE